MVCTIFYFDVLYGCRPSSRFETIAVKRQIQNLKFGIVHLSIVEVTPIVGLSPTIPTHRDCCWCCRRMLAIRPKGQCSTALLEHCYNDHSHLVSFNLTILRFINDIIINKNFQCAIREKEPNNAKM